LEAKAANLFLSVIRSGRHSYQFLKNGVSNFKGASGIDSTLGIVIVGGNVMIEISVWTCMFPPLRDGPRAPALIRMQVEVPSSVEKPQ
jgi:hypothetical protein